MKSVKQIADYEAKVKLIQCGVRQLNDVVFMAPSFTRERDHVVTVIDGVVTYCSECRGFQTYEHCSHGDAVMRYIAEEQGKTASLASDPFFTGVAEAEVQRERTRREQSDAELRKTDPFMGGMLPPRRQEEERRHNAPLARNEVKRNECGIPMR